MNSVEQLTDDNAGKLVLTGLPEEQKGQKTLIGLRNDEYKRIVVLARRGGEDGVTLNNKSGEHRFYFKDDKLFGEKCNEDGGKETHEVINVDDLPVEAMNPNANRTKLYDQLKAEVPDLSDDDIMAYIDIMYEAQRSMQTLIHQGVPAAEAQEIVMDALKSDTDRKLNKVEVEYVTSK